MQTYRKGTVLPWNIVREFINNGVKISKKRKEKSQTPIKEFGIFYILNYFNYTCNALFPVAANAASLIASAKVGCA